MNKLFRNEKGISLVELLAALLIGSLIMIFIISIHIFIQKQYESQSKDIQRLTDVTIAAKAITTDIRKAEEVKAEDNKSITMTIEDNETTYAFEDGILKKNGNPYLYNVANFKVDQTGSKITLTIFSESGKEISTEIIMRGDNQDD